MLNTALAPTIDTLYYSIYYFLVHHPLLNSQLVKNRLDGSVVDIAQYRLMGGFPVHDGLTCSIYPLSSSDYLATPAGINMPVLYNSYDAHTDEARYHFVIDYSLRSINFDGLHQVTDPDLIRVPAEHTTFPKDRGIKSRRTKDVTLYVNPALDIIAQYLELTRLALVDAGHVWKFPLGGNDNDYVGTLSKVEPIHCSLPTVASWEKGTSVLDTRGYLMIRMNAYPTRDWRTLWHTPVTGITVNK